jgi:xanthine/uracil permease
LNFFAIIGGKVPSYLGSSFSFIAVVSAQGATPAPGSQISYALRDILAAGALCTAIGILVQLAGYRWIERLMRLR